MTEKILFRIMSGPIVEITLPTGIQKVHTLGDLKSVLDSVNLDDLQSARSFGILAAFFAAYELSHVGTDPTRSSILRTLDEYYFVLQNEDLNAQFQSGLHVAIEKIQELFCSAL